MRQGGRSGFGENTEVLKNLQRCSLTKMTLLIDPLKPTYRLKDNAACEGFFGRLKNEMYYDREWNDVSIEKSIALVDGYVRWKNHSRIKLSLGGLSPLEYRQTLEMVAQ